MGHLIFGEGWVFSLIQFFSVASRAIKFFSYIVNAATFCSEGIFFFTRQNMGQIFFFQLGAGQIFFGQNQSEKFCSKLPKNELVSVLGDMVTGMIVNI